MAKKVKRKTKKTNNNKKVLMLTVISILVLVVLISTTYARFFASESTEKQELYESRNDLSVIFDDESSDAITLNPTQPVSDSYGSRLKPYTFTIKNTGNSLSTYEIKITNEVITNPNGLTNEQVRENIKYQINDNEPQLLSTTLEDGIITGCINPGDDALTFNIRLWIKSDAQMEIEKTTYQAKIAVTGQAVNKCPN